MRLCVVCTAGTCDPDAAIVARGGLVRECKATEAGELCPSHSSVVICSQDCRDRAEVLGLLFRDRAGLLGLRSSQRCYHCDGEGRARRLKEQALENDRRDRENGTGKYSKKHLRMEAEQRARAEAKKMKRVGTLDPGLQPFAEGGKPVYPGHKTIFVTREKTASELRREADERDRKRRKIESVYGDFSKRFAGIMTPAAELGEVEPETAAVVVDAVDPACAKRIKQQRVSRKRRKDGLLRMWGKLENLKDAAVQVEQSARQKPDSNKAAYTLLSFFRPVTSDPR